MEKKEIKVLVLAATLVATLRQLKEQDLGDLPVEVLSDLADNLIGGIQQVEETAQRGLSELLNKRADKESSEKGFKDFLNKLGINLDDIKEPTKESPKDTPRCTCPDCQEEDLKNKAAGKEPEDYTRPLDAKQAVEVILEALSPVPNTSYYKLKLHKEYAKSILKLNAKDILKAGEGKLDEDLLNQLYISLAQLDASVEYKRLALEKLKELHS